MDIRKELINQGFNGNNVVHTTFTSLTGEKQRGYLVEGDIFISETQLQEMSKNNKPPTTIMVNNTEQIAW
ncbi:MAG TPA: hypothetical protein DCS93_32050 [Microscillaceae bacterium]|nr:hypothetical protein [Microscillaceae bacterium]